ncbi:hypothetical protein F5Y09DRAFT_64158 [Xylaria sp. FL1042]|nr:hypothetical protein F5Y09DRAFT_64158 [Xylaria sp. FL1042]
MTNLPSQHPDLALHLTDAALTPLITSARAHHHLEYLSALSHTALDAHESAQRLALGAPQRIMVEHGEGPVLLQTFLSPHTPNTTQHSTTTTTTTSQLSPSTDPPQQRQRQQQQQQQQQHKGALALAVENRGVGSTSTSASASASASSTTEAHPRRGAAAAAAASPEAEDHNNAIYPDEHNNNNTTTNTTTNTNTNTPTLGTLTIDDVDTGPDPNSPPMLLGIVVAATSDSALEARRAAARLERVGREIQGRWAELQGASSAPPGRTRGPQGGDTAAGD